MAAGDPTGPEPRHFVGTKEAASRREPEGAFQKAALV